MFRSIPLNSVSIQNQLSLFHQITQRIASRNALTMDFDQDPQVVLFLERLCKLILMAPSREMAKQAWAIVTLLCQSLYPNDKIKLIMFLLSVPVSTVSVLAITLVKETLILELEEAETDFLQLLTASFYPILFDKDSSLYKDQDRHILKDKMLFIEKLDILFQVVNFYRFLQLKDVNRCIHKLLPKSQQEIITRTFLNPTRAFIVECAAELDDCKSSVSVDFEQEGGDLQRCRSTMMLLKDIIDQVISHSPEIGE